MMTRASCRVAVVLAFVAACSTGDNSVDPGDLELRDLLGIAPEIASAWSPAQRASARRVLIAGLFDEQANERASLAPDPGAIDPGAIDPGAPDPAAVDVD